MVGMTAPTIDWEWVSTLTGDALETELTAITGVRCSSPAYGGQGESGGNRLAFPTSPDDLAWLGDFRADLLDGRRSGSTTAPHDWHDVMGDAIDAIRAACPSVDVALALTAVMHGDVVSGPGRVVGTRLARHLIGDDSQASVDAARDGLALALAPMERRIERMLDCDDRPARVVRVPMIPPVLVLGDVRGGASRSAGAWHVKRHTSYRLSRSAQVGAERAERLTVHAPGQAWRGSRAQVWETTLVTRPILEPIYRRAPIIEPGRVPVSPAWGYAGPPLDPDSGVVAWWDARDAIPRVSVWDHYEDTGRTTLLPVRRLVSTTRVVGQATIRARIVSNTGGAWERDGLTYSLRAALRTLRRALVAAGTSSVPTVTLTRADGSTRTRIGASVPMPRAIGRRSALPWGTGTVTTLAAPLFPRPWNLVPMRRIPSASDARFSIAVWGTTLVRGITTGQGRGMGADGRPTRDALRRVPLAGGSTIDPGTLREAVARCLGCDWTGASTGQAREHVKTTGHALAVGGGGSYVEQAPDGKAPRAKRAASGAKAPRALRAVTPEVASATYGHACLRARMTR
jgi:hypothetical protein